MLKKLKATFLNHKMSLPLSVDHYLSHLWSRPSDNRTWKLYICSPGRHDLGRVMHLQQPRLPILCSQDLQTAAVAHATSVC